MSNLLNHFTANSTAINTTDAVTVTTITSWTPASHSPVINNCIVSVAGQLIGKDGSNNAVSIKANATFSIISGTVTLLGSQSSIFAAQGSAGLSTAVLTLDTSSNVIRLRATGVAATTIAWTGWLWVLSTSF